MLQELQNAILTFKDAWLIKAIASFLTAFLISSQGKLLMIFTVLVFIDLFTKFLALSKKRLDEQGRKEASLFVYLWNIPAARKDGYIKSEPMRQRFLGKFVWYVLIAILATVLDINMAQLGESQYFVKLMVTYMAISEGISIIENLSAAGVHQAGDLLEIIKAERKGLR